MLLVMLTVLLMIASIVQPLPDQSSSLATSPGSVAHGMEKRQASLYATREAGINFHCHVAGPLSTTHAWRVIYTPAHGRLEIDGLRNMYDWTTPVTSGNAFSSNWRYRFCRTFETHCCCYGMLGTVSGSVALATRSIRTTIFGRAHGLTVVEFCLEVEEDEMCPAKTVVLAASARECDVTSVTIRTP